MAYPPTFDANGFTPSTPAEILAYFTAQFKAIYGADVNLTSASFDGQWLNIMVQTVLDMQNLFQQGNASMDPDQAVGATLDSRVTINGIQRNTGTFSTVGVNVTVSQGLTLNGLDALVANPNATVYTIADAAGTQWNLQQSTTFAGAGTQLLTFQAAQPGPALAQAATLVNMVTIVLGVTSVTNPVAVVSPNIGVAQETDNALRQRRRASVSIGAQGVHDALVAALLNIPGITYATVYENTSGATSDGTVAGVPAGIPRNSIWVVVNGPKDLTTQNLIAQAIYQKRNVGCGMFGGTQNKITQLDGTPFYVYWDYVASIRSYVQFSAHSINGTSPINVANLQAQIALQYVPPIGAALNSTALIAAIAVIDPNCNVTAVEFSLDAVHYSNPLAVPLASEQFTIAAGDIQITVI